MFKKRNKVIFNSYTIFHLIVNIMFITAFLGSIILNACNHESMNLQSSLKPEICYQAVPRGDYLHRVQEVRDAYNRQLSRMEE